MPVTRAILLFPKFSNGDIIDGLRKRFDPLCNLIQPHITLVFPFTTNLSLAVLEQHMTDELSKHAHIPLALQGITGADGGYLFLNVKIGNDAIISLHDDLYSGVLEPFLNRSVSYHPHLTIGRLPDEQTVSKALRETADIDDRFTTTVEDVYVETIDPVSQKSQIEFCVSLKGTV